VKNRTYERGVNKMKKLDERDWKTLKNALNFKQLEELCEKGVLTLNKEQAIQVLKESIELDNTTMKEVKKNMPNVTDEKMIEMLNTYLKNGEEINKRETELLERLQQDEEDYIIGFMKGARG
jgi:membrane-associated HD superfamily phosphohydrolase